MPRRPVATALLLAAMIVSAPRAGAGVQHRLTFQDRLQAQLAIERVYYSHIIGATKPFEQAVPPQVIERKVRTYLKESLALERFWAAPVTDQALQAEMSRIALHTRFPDRLREIYAALDDDPVLVAECLARPVLVDRLARGYFERDERIHGRAKHSPDEARTSSDEDPTWDGWWDGVAGDLGESEVETVASGETLLSDPASTGEALTTSATSTCVPDDTWGVAGNPGSVASARRDHAVVWTGNEMIAFGGWGFEVVAGSGSRYNPLTDSWTPTSLQNAPLNAGAIAWTGSEMLEWDSAAVAGARYDPAGDIWRPMASANAPSSRFGSSAVWAGTEWIIWGGAPSAGGVTNTGARYDPVADMWTSLPPGPTATYYHTAVWTGTQMIVWGGEDAQGGLPSGGARYTRATDKWSKIASSGAPEGRLSHTAVWTGTRMIVWGGSGASAVLASGGRYDPATNRWDPTSTSGAADSRALHTAVWTGSEMVIWGGDGGSSAGVLSSGGRYNPGTDAWMPTPSVNAPPARQRHSAVWTGSLMIVWGGEDGSSTFPFWDGGRLDPISNSWTPINATLPARRSFHSAVWTGAEMLVWGGEGQSVAVCCQGLVNVGERYDPLVDSWTPMSTTGAPGARYLNTAVWTGSEMIVWGGSTGSLDLATGGRYNPVSDSWALTSTLNAPSARSFATGVWTGSRMIVWGGQSGSTYLDTGGRYDPVADTWLPTSTYFTLSPRSGHKAIWTGSVMVVVGGSNGVLFPNYTLGALYDPGTDTWSRMTGVPLTRGLTGHTAVWSGQYVYIWGGGYDGGATNGGSRYDPISDSLTSISSANAPSARRDPLGVWTGREMLVWGGLVSGQPVNSGGRYDPSTSSWTATSLVGAPAVRSVASMVWAGGSAIVWGGELDSQQVHAVGGTYALGQGTDDDGDGFSECAGDCNDADPTVHPGAVELCNGRDDNCDGLADNGDADGDGAANCMDCAPQDASAIRTPGPVTGVSAGAIPNGLRLTWADQSGTAGSGTRYDIFSGSLAAVRAVPWSFSSGTCAMDDHAGATADVIVPDPPPGQAIYVLIRAQNGCAAGTGTYGDANRDATASASAGACH
ncbi:MAG: hypothetical protein HY049_02960 [Acidobacteria bacterium]|nr:hypothetical protein [Acidobacteriota bacterium]